MDLLDEPTCMGAKGLDEVMSPGGGEGFPQAKKADRAIPFQALSYSRLASVFPSSPP